VFARALVHLGLDAGRAQELAPMVRSRYVAGESWRLYDDALPTLQTLSGLGWSQAILSNHVPELPAIVEYLGLAPYLLRVMTSAQMGYEKPHPRIFELALEETGQADVLWMVGDSYCADVHGPEVLGLRAILVRSQHPKARYACEDLVEVASLIESQ